MGKQISYITQTILYYGIVFPISLLPLGILYYLADLLFFILWYIYPYRKKYVRKNIRNSFPSLNQIERKRIKKQFYKYFADLLIESITNLSITKKELLRRVKVSNPKVLDELFEKNKSVLLVSGHYNNWEWFITAQNMLMKHQAIGVGTAITNPFWDKTLTKQRSRFGMEIINANEIHQTFQKHQGGKPTATLLLSDQSPIDINKAYWMKFLNQSSPVFFGCELLAHQYNQAVVFFTINRVKRGKYRIDFELICEEPKELNWGEITEKHVRLLEKTIIQKPQFWLWSHNRWKKNTPENLEEIKKAQQLKFQEKFKTTSSETN